MLLPGPSEPFQRLLTRRGCRPEAAQGEPRCASASHEAAASTPADQVRPSVCSFVRSFVRPSVRPSVALSLAEPSLSQFSQFDRWSLLPFSPSFEEFFCYASSHLSSSSPPRLFLIHIFLLVFPFFEGEAAGDQGVQQLRAVRAHDAAARRRLRRGTARPAVARPASACHTTRPQVRVGRCVATTTTTTTARQGNGGGGGGGGGGGSGGGGRGRGRAAPAACRGCCVRRHARRRT